MIDSSNSHWDPVSDVITDEEKGVFRNFNNTRNTRLKVDDTTPVGIVHTQSVMYSGGAWYVVFVNFDGKEEASIGVVLFEDLFKTLHTMLAVIADRTGLEGMDLPGVYVAPDGDDETGEGKTLN